MWTAVLAGIGAVMSLLSWGCVNVHAKDPKDTKLFGRLHLAVIGIIGYTLVALACLNPITKLAAVVVVGLFTVYLVIKALRIKLGCPVCPVVWALNVCLVLSVFFSHGS